MFKRTLAIALLGSQLVSSVVAAEDDRSAVLENIKPVGSVTVAGQAPAVATPPVQAPATAPEAPAAAPEAPAAVVEAAPAAVEAAPAVAASADGNAVYMKACFACHGTGAAGAPKYGDKAAWAPRVATGMDALMHSALNGKNAMPPKGGQMQLTEAEIAAAVHHMLDAVK